MQTATLTIHIVGVILALYIYRNRREWRYFALMLLFSNFIGALFYILVLFDIPTRHELSAYRSFMQAVILLAFGLGLAKDGTND